MFESLLGMALRAFRAGEERTAWQAFARDDGIHTLDLQCTDFPEGGVIPVHFWRHAEQGTKSMLTWGAVPAEARTCVLIVEDPDVPLPMPFVHLAVYNIPADARCLTVKRDSKSGGDEQYGLNALGGRGWIPPRPIAGHGVHRYIFQLFALDLTLPVERIKTRARIVTEMTGHVVARGRLVGTCER